MDNTTNKKCKKRILELSAGQSNRAFAEKCAVSEGTIRNIKKGILPGRATLEKIAKTHGKTIGYLLGEENTGKSSEKTSEPQGKYLQSIITMWPELSEDDKREIFASAKKAKRLREMYNVIAGIEKKAGANGN